MSGAGSSERAKGVGMEAVEKESEQSAKRQLPADSESAVSRGTRWALWEEDKRNGAPHPRVGLLFLSSSNFESTVASLLRARYPYLAPSLDLDHLVVGGGAVGLAVAERLIKGFPDRTTFLVERHAQAGQETSSRNSEVIHSGLYYPTTSLKTALCIQGRSLLYARCALSSIPHRKTGKLILATCPSHQSYLSSLVRKAEELRATGVGEVPLRWLSGEEARELEPDLGGEVVGALLSPETGIVSSHALMEDLEREIGESEKGELVFGTRVVRIDKVEGGGGKRGDGSEDGWVVQTVTNDGGGGEGERSAVLARVVINSAGLNAHHIVNQILPAPEHRKLFFAKGSYFSYRGPGISSVKHLLYPCPDPSSLAGLGTHLTMNLSNEIRFGPDIEWLEAPLLDGEEEMDFWARELGASEERMGDAVAEVQKYLPGVRASGFAPDYSGIRPKLSPRNAQAEDFSISHPRPGFLSLEGIESPGLTSSLAIGVRVEEMVRREVWGSRGGRMSEVGGSLDAWG